MKLRFTILNLLLFTTVIALSIAVIQISRDLKEERRLRTELLQKGGLLEISDVEKVHIVPVHARHEPHTLRWRIYVPPGKTVVLSTKSKPHPDRNVLEPRICNNEPVVSDRNRSNPITIPSGQHVITYKYSRSEFGRKHVSFAIDVRGDTFVGRGSLRSEDGDMDWLASNYYEDLTWLERPGGKKGRYMINFATTSQVDVGKHFVLFRFREIPKKNDQQDAEPDKSIPEVFAWFTTE